MRDEGEAIQQGQPAVPSPPLLVEMLRSFIELAETLNLSQAVRRTGATRQTLRRHIAVLEQLRGERLFDLDDRRYVLTAAGHRALDGAADIIARADAWTANITGHLDGLLHINSGTDLGVEYHLQHHPLGKLWETGAPLLRVAFKVWAQSAGRLDADAFQAIRPYLIVFRKVDDKWICVEVGEQSSYASWYGMEWAKSTIGLSSDSLPAGRGFARLLMAPFEDVRASESARYDHILTEMIREKNGALIPISFQRMLLSIVFPNGSRGIVSVVERTHSLKIQGLTEANFAKMQPELVMNTLSDTL